MRVRMVGPMLALGVLVAPGMLRAQEREAVLTVQVMSSDQLGRLPVSRSDGDVRQLLGTAVRGSPLQLDMNRVNIGKGRRVAVNVQNNELILVEQGVVDQRCEEARRGDRSGWCEEVAVLTWGTSATLGIASTAGVIQVTTRQPTPTPKPKPRFGIGTQFYSTNFFRLDDVACDMAAIPGLTACDAESSSITIGGYAEYQWSERFAIGAGYNRMKYTVHQEYGTESVRHEVKVAAIDVFGRFSLMPGAKVRPWGIFGWSYYDNEDEVFWDDDPYESRGQGGPRILIGGGVDYRFVDRLDLRALVRYGGGAERDADSHWGVGFGIGYNF